MAEFLWLNSPVVWLLIVLALAGVILTRPGSGWGE